MINKPGPLAFCLRFFGGSAWFLIRFTYVKCENVTLDAYHQRQTLVFSFSLIALSYGLTLRMCKGLAQWTVVAGHKSILVQTVTSREALLVHKLQVDVAYRSNT